jgi:hypothetical protein
MSRIYPRVLYPLHFYRHEREILEEAFAAVRDDAGVDGPPLLDGQCVEYLCADWLARWGAGDRSS